MNKYFILVEGKADAIFLRDLLFYIFPELKEGSIKYEFKKENEKKSKLLEIEIAIKSKNNEILIWGIGGCKNIEHLKVNIETQIVKSFKIIVIQDADNDNKDKEGGVTKRTRYLKNLKKDLEIDFEFFLLPNNKAEYIEVDGKKEKVNIEIDGKIVEDRDLEILLLQITKIEKYSIFKENFEKYALSVEKFSSEKFCKELLESKSKIYQYFQAYQGKEKAKEEKRIYNDELWDFNNEALQPLKDFIIENIIINNKI